MATLLYTALADGLTINSAIASWPWPRTKVAPLESTRPSTIALLAAGKIALAVDGATDTTTPANVVRGQPGLHRLVGN